MKSKSTRIKQPQQYLLEHRAAVLVFSWHLICTDPSEEAFLLHNNLSTAFPLSVPGQKAVELVEPVCQVYLAEILLQVLSYLLCYKIQK